MITGINGESKQLDRRENIKTWHQLQKWTLHGENKKRQFEMMTDNRDSDIIGLKGRILQQEVAVRWMYVQLRQRPLQDMLEPSLAMR
jgi:hypothetical protein